MIRSLASFLHDVTYEDTSCRRGNIYVYIYKSSSFRIHGKTIPLTDPETSSILPIFPNQHRHNKQTTDIIKSTKHKMPHHHTATRTTATRRHHGLFSRAQPVHHHQKRHATLGDKVSGALLKLKGTLTRRPGQKVRRRDELDTGVSCTTSWSGSCSRAIRIHRHTHAPMMARRIIYSEGVMLTCNHRPPGPAACTAQTAGEAVGLGSHLVASTATRRPPQVRSRDMR